MHWKPDPVVDARPLALRRQRADVSRARNAARATLAPLTDQSVRETAELERRQLSMSVLEWSVVVIELERAASQTSKELAATIRERLAHPTSQVRS